MAGLSRTLHPTYSTSPFLVSSQLFHLLFLAFTASYYVMLSLIIILLFFLLVSLSLLSPQVGVVMLQWLQCTWLCRASIHQVFPTLSVLLHPPSLPCTTRSSLFLHVSLRDCGTQHGSGITIAESSVCCKCMLLCRVWHIITAGCIQYVERHFLWLSLSACDAWQNSDSSILCVDLNAYQKHSNWTAYRGAHSVKGVLINHSYSSRHHSGWGRLLPGKKIQTAEHNTIRLRYETTWFPVYTKKTAEFLHRVASYLFPSSGLGCSTWQNMQAINLQFMHMHYSLLSAESLLHPRLGHYVSVLRLHFNQTYRSTIHFQEQHTIKLVCSKIPGRSTSSQTHRPPLTGPHWLMQWLPLRCSVSDLFTCYCTEFLVIWCSMATKLCIKDTND